MRRLLLLLVFGAMILGMTSSASAGWFHFGRHFRHFHHVRHHVHRWVHRPHFHRYHVHRSYHVRPRFSSYGFCFPWHHVIRYHVPVIRYHVPVIRHYRVYHSTPFCATEPAATTTWSYAQSRAVTGTPSVERQAAESRLARAANQFVRPKVVDFDAEREPAAAAAAAVKLASARTELRRTTPQDSPGWSQLNGEQRLVDLGERLFRGQFYEEALSKFESAAQRTPSAAGLHVRRGHALVALGRYEQAALAFQRAVTLDPRFVHASWRLERLYGSQNRAALDKHVETLAGAALQSAGDSNLYFLIGVYLHCDGQVDRAEPFFRQAAESEPQGAAHLRVFLDEEAPRPTRDKLAAAGAAPAVAQTSSLPR